MIPLQSAGQELLSSIYQEVQDEPRLLKYEQSLSLKLPVFMFHKHASVTTHAQVQSAQPLLATYSQDP